MFRLFGMFFRESQPEIYRWALQKAKKIPWLGVLSSKLAQLEKPAWFCFTAAWNSWSRGWFHLPNFLIGKAIANQLIPNPQKPIPNVQSVSIGINYKPGAPQPQITFGNAEYDDVRILPYGDFKRLYPGLVIQQLKVHVYGWTDEKGAFHKANENIELFEIIKRSNGSYSK